MPAVHVVEDDASAAAFYATVASQLGHTARVFPTAEAFLAFADGEESAVVLLDLRLPDKSGLDVLADLTLRGIDLPVVALSAVVTVRLAARAMAAGAVNAVEKLAPVHELRAALAEAFGIERVRRERRRMRRDAAVRFAGLVSRERDVLSLALDGMPNKTIARELGISERTVERHRGAAFEKLGVGTIAEAAALRAIVEPAPVSLTLGGSAAPPFRTAGTASPPPLTGLDVRSEATTPPVEPRFAWVVT